MSQAFTYSKLNPTIPNKDEVGKEQRSQGHKETDSLEYKPISKIMLLLSTMFSS